MSASVGTPCRKPKLITVTARPLGASPRLAKACTRRLHSCTLLWVVSRCSVARSRKGNIRVRSVWMASGSDKPSRARGCGRREVLKRRSSASSLASKKRTWVATPACSSPLSKVSALSGSGTLRASRPSASRKKRGLPRAISMSVGSMGGGRLSTQNQPRSSRALSAVEMPEPDRPVTTSSCKPPDGGPPALSGTSVVPSGLGGLCSLTPPPHLR
jgi:hypothetical protein